MWPNRLVVPLVGDEAATGSLATLYPSVKALLSLHVLEARHLHNESCAPASSSLGLLDSSFYGHCALPAAYNACGVFALSALRPLSTGMNLNHLSGV